MAAPWKMPKANSTSTMPQWRTPRADYFRGTKGARLVSKHAWDTSKDLIASIKDNAQTFVETPTSNRWVGKNGQEYLEPKRGMRRKQLESTAIESVIIDKDISKGDRYKVSISFVGEKGKYYDYWATETEIEDLMKAPSKGREVALKWNHNPEKHYP